MAMKLGFIGGKKPDQLGQAIRLAQEFGYTGLEFDYWREFETWITDAVVQEMKKTLQAVGIEVCAYGLWGYNPLSRDPQERASSLRVMDQAIRGAEALGARTMVFNTGRILGEPLGRNIAEFVEVFDPILARVRSAGMEATFYAVHGGFLDGLAACERLWEARPDVKLKYDPANWISHGDDYLEVVRRYGHKIGHVHIKELIRDARGTTVSQPPAGMGEVQWGKVLAFLYEHDYDGYLSVEPHMDPWRTGKGLRRNLALSKRHVSQFLL
jgi:sugar phosphate isomerase/epimerase